MIEVSVNLDGLDRLIRDLDSKGKSEITQAMADAVLIEAVKIVPLKTGALKKSGRVEKGVGSAHKVVFGGDGAEHALALHEGRAQPTSGTKRWLRTAAMTKRPIIAAAAKALKKIIKRNGRA